MEIPTMQTVLKDCRGQHNGSCSPLGDWKVGLFCSELAYLIVEANRLRQRGEKIRFSFAFIGEIFCWRCENTNVFIPCIINIIAII